MKAKTVVNLIAVLFGIVAFLLVPYVPVAESNPDPTNSQMVHFIVLSVFESIGIVVGIIFAYRARALLRAGLLSALTYFSVFWMLISWWPHDRLHALIEHGDYWSLIFIEYGFHVTLILAAICVAIWVRKHSPAVYELQAANGSLPPESEKL